MTERSKDQDPDYDVGFGRPPVQHQFQPGRSGNPKGRPKKSKSSTEPLDQMILRIQRETVTLNTSAGPKTISTGEAILRTALTAAAKKGNVKAIMAIFDNEKPTSVRGGTDYRAEVELKIEQLAQRIKERKALEASEKSKESQF